MADARWDFPELNGGNIQGYTNSGIETFRGAELIDNLAREICQNSLDAKDTSLKEPVVVEFELQTVNKSDYSLFQEYENCIAGCRTFWEKNPEKKVMSFIERVEAVLAKDQVKILRISDYNTTGLTGSNASGNEKSKWIALVNADGVSAEKDASAGGSYGIGKNAPFACSDISVVFYNTYAKDDKKAFQGVARAATLYKDDNKMVATQGIGHYRSTESYRAITSEIDCCFRDKFTRDKYGTDIIIVGCEKLNENNDWQDKLEQAIVRNFLLAIRENKLVVKIGNKTINSENLKNIIDDCRTKTSNTAMQTVRFFDTIAEPENGVKTETVIENNDLEIYLKSDKNYKREIANFRTTGMLVGIDFRRMMQNFTAVVVVRGEKLGEILRLTEPPKHNKWDYKLIEDKEESKKAKKYIDDIREKVRKLIDENYKIITEDTVNADDVGEYLPDELEDLVGKNRQSGEDKLSPVQKVSGEPKTYEFPKDNHNEIAKSTIGDSVNDESGARNQTQNPEPYPGPKIPPEVDPSTGGSTGGVSKGEGTKTYTTYPDLKLQKIFAMNPKLGLYKLILKPINYCEKIYVNFSAIGEGLNTDAIAVEKYTINNQRFDGKGSKIGPIVIAADVENEVFITFRNKEKMAINMEITEEVKI